MTTMMTLRATTRPLVLVVVAACVVLFELHSRAYAIWPSDSRDFLTVSLPDIALTSSEAIVKIQCNLAAAPIVKIHVLDGWDVHVTNGETSKSTLKAQAIFQSAGLRKGDLSYFNDFLTIQEKEPFPDERLFNLSIRITITDTTNPKENRRYMDFSTNQIALKKTRSP